MLTLPYFSVYHATKFAVEGLTESLQYELAPFNIKLKLIEPGGVKTDFAHRSLSLANEGSSFNQYEQHFTNFLIPCNHAEMPTQVQNILQMKYIKQ